MRSTLLAPLAALLFAADCGDGGRVVSPHLRRVDEGPRAAASYVATGRALERTTPLPDTIVAYVVAVPGYPSALQVRAAGLELDIPAQAVTAPTLVRVTVPPGRRIYYELEPHGLLFDAAVEIRQDLQGTTAYRNAALARDLRGAYLSRGTLDLADDGTARIAELFPVEIEPEANRVNPHLAKFFTRHFSGYIWASGVTMSGSE